MNGYAPHRGPTSHVLTHEDVVSGGSSRSERKRQAALDGKNGFIRWRDIDPEPGRIACVHGGTQAMRRRYRCGDCLMVSTACGISSHQRSKGHEGRIALPLERFDEDADISDSPKEQ